MQLMSKPSNMAQLAAVEAALNDKPSDPGSRATG
jgi:hypothetical protein